MVERAARRACDGVRDGCAQLEAEHTEQDPPEEGRRVYDLSTCLVYSEYSEHGRWNQHSKYWYSHSKYSA